MQIEKERIIRILFSSIRATGHFNPLVPVARGLAERGHEVGFAGIAELGERIADAGFEHLEIDEPSESTRTEIDKFVETLPPEEAGRWYVPNVFMRVLAKTALPSFMRQIQVWKPDLIVRETCEFASLMAGNACGVPTVRIEVVNGESEEGIASRYCDALDELRASVGLAPDNGACLRSEPSFSAHPSVLDRTSRVNSASPMRYSIPEIGLEPSQRHDWFPNATAPFVYVTFGTALAGYTKSAKLYGGAIEALRELPINALFTIGKDAPDDLFSAPIPDNVVIRSFVPQTEVLDQADLMVCHGGSGTVLGGLEAGVPLVIAPVFADQPDNANCLDEAGLAYVVRDALDPDFARRLATAIEAALADNELRKRTQTARTEIKKTATLDEALDAIILNAKPAPARK